MPRALLHGVLRALSRGVPRALSRWVPRALSRWVLRAASPPDPGLPDSAVQQLATRLHISFKTRNRKNFLSLLTRE